MSEWSTNISQDNINAYADVSGDFNPIHVDPEFAKNTPYGSTIAHGCIAGAVMTRYVVEVLGYANGPKSLTVKFVNATRSGDSLSCSFESGARDDTTAEGDIVLQITCLNQKDEVVAVGKALVDVEVKP